MIISYDWLKTMLDIPVSPEELTEILTFLGLEVEDVTHYRPVLERVVIGQVLECVPMPGSDHLAVTKTSIGGETLQIVCGAPNVQTGQKVLVMLPDSVTADGRRVKKAKLRGIESSGMIASEAELGLSSDHTGIIEGDPDWRVGANAADYVGIPDTIYDVEITPNRPDYLGHVGVARDLAAKFRIPWRLPALDLVEVQSAADSEIQVVIEAPDACPRYAARVVRGLTIAPSPYSVRLRLTRCGVRPISNIVDVTNYVMLEFGHPLHAFDKRFIGGNRIVVRYAHPNEVFVTLDGKDHQLAGRDLLIADVDKGIALAGIMGGQNSEIREDTTDVVIECAYFDPVHIRRTAKSHELGTESSRRFERGTDPNNIPRVIDVSAAMMQRLAGGQVLSGRVDVYPRAIHGGTISFRPKRVLDVVGLEIEPDEMQQTLSRIGCEVKQTEPSWSVLAPTYRPDLTREIDLIEEVIRVHGYNGIPVARSSKVPLEGNRNELFRFRARIVDAMVAMGFRETMSLSMYTSDDRRDPPGMPEGVALANPVTDDMKTMQGSLLPQLVRSAAVNWLRGDRNLRLFEAARVFQTGEPDDPRTWERQVVSAVMTGQSYPQSWSYQDKPLDFYDLRGVIEVLCTRIPLDKYEIFCYDIESGELLRGELRAKGEVCGQWGIWPTKVMRDRDLDATVGWFEFDIGRLFELKDHPPKYSPLPRFPVSWRDVAVIVDESVRAADIVNSIRFAGGVCLLRCTPFDVFRSERLGSGKKSLAFRIEFEHPERSLEAEEVDQWMNSIVRELETRHAAQLR